MVWMRHSSGVNSTAVLALVVLPLGRPGFRFGAAAGIIVALLLAGLAAFSAAVRSTCSIWMGNERRRWVLISDRVKNANPGTTLPYRPAKKRSSPWVCLPALVTTVSSPPTR